MLKNSNFDKTIHTKSQQTNEVVTCGTHFGETKLVLSITLKPVSDNLFMKSIFVSVGMIFCKQQKELGQNVPTED